MTGHENEVQQIKLDGEPIRTSSRRFDKVNDNTIYVRADRVDKNSKRDLFSFVEINIEFSNCKLESQYDEKQGPDYIKAYGFDYQQNVLVLMKVNPQKKKLGKRVTIINLSENAIIYQGKVTDKELSGRLKTSLYTFIDGHFYYNNNCIKIRYDLLKQKNNARDYTEYEIFDYYDNVL